VEKDIADKICASFGDIFEKPDDQFYRDFAKIVLTCKARKSNAAKKKGPEYNSSDSG